MWCRKEEHAMDKEYAKKVIFDNCYGRYGSLVDSLYNDGIFSNEKFWDYHNSIVTLAALRSEEKTFELTMQINMSYQRILKEFLWHFDPNDIAHFDGFPKNYTDYIERLDFAVLAYFNGDLSLVSDERFELMEESLKGV